MVFENSEDAFDGVVLAVVRRIIRKRDVYTLILRELHDSLDELSATAAVFRTVVRVYDERMGVESPFQIRPKLPDPVHHEIRGYVAESKEEVVFPRLGDVDSEKLEDSFRLEIVVEGLFALPAVSASGEQADFYRGLGVDAYSDHALRLVRQLVDSVHVVENVVRLRYFFLGFVLAVFCGLKPNSFSLVRIVRSVGSSRSSYPISSVNRRRTSPAVSGQ